MEQDFSPVVRVIKDILTAMDGDVPEYVVNVIAQGHVAREDTANVLLFATLWCRERRNGVFPEKLLAAARAFAPHTPGVDCMLMAVIGFLTNDHALKEAFAGRLPHPRMLFLDYVQAAFPIEVLNEDEGIRLRERCRS